MASCSQGSQMSNSTVYSNLSDLYHCYSDQEKDRIVSKLPSEIQEKLLAAIRCERPQIDFIDLAEHSDYSDFLRFSDEEKSDERSSGSGYLYSSDEEGNGTISVYVTERDRQHQYSELIAACYDSIIFNHYVPDEQLPIAYRTNSSINKVSLPESHSRLQRAIVKVATELFGHFDSNKNQSMSHHTEAEKSSNISFSPDWIRVQQDLWNFLRCPGTHTCNSPIVGSRASELLQFNIPSNAWLISLEKTLRENPGFYPLMPLDKKDEADAIARRYFLDYIKKYELAGATEDNIVDWTNSGEPDTYSNKTYLNQGGVWRVRAVVEMRHGKYNEKFGLYRPPHLVAYHELMHVEETPKLISGNILPCYELMPTLKSMILYDLTYKEVHGIQEDNEVDYKRFIWLDSGNRVPLGQFINFYRNLEKQYQGLCPAILSPESKQFCTGREE